ncbi:uncharacterized protein AMSG_01909 [Thecamonas trahens ATCC 50062]|uniref:Uncharacterized protein n=1 Tax=Thecamonas trahens ATCC 50062 TaxID=461836 RepID=A0A0L0DTR5_THETB|nr:hypothetical protein AMSG_01909 [Thecamonas trahens ATCC 50062]KNC55640.1 hypothetical protein AMSG_01909 [Thecamonas trahens ATCC 50062]|eukprot:XP_013761410.1 hypothetical protein AMSG_01909 [Thecamonas trahens ATCC 50062]
MASNMTAFDSIREWINTGDAGMTAQKRRLGFVYVMAEVGSTMRLNKSGQKAMRKLRNILSHPMDVESSKLEVCYPQTLSAVVPEALAEMKKQLDRGAKLPLKKVLGRLKALTDDDFEAFGHQWGLSLANESIYQRYNKPLYFSELAGSEFTNGNSHKTIYIDSDALTDALGERGLPLASPLCYASDETQEEAIASYIDATRSIDEFVLLDAADVCPEDMLGERRLSQLYSRLKDAIKRRNHLLLSSYFKDDIAAVLDHEPLGKFDQALQRHFGGSRSRMVAAFKPEVVTDLVGEMRIEAMWNTGQVLKQLRESTKIKKKSVKTCPTTTGELAARMAAINDALTTEDGGGTIALITAIAAVAQTPGTLFDQPCNKDHPDIGFLFA